MLMGIFYRPGASLFCLPKIELQRKMLPKQKRRAGPATSSLGTNTLYMHSSQDRPRLGYRIGES